jgi:ABC-2 type transport system ATP-binding protein
VIASLRCRGLRLRFPSGFTVGPLDLDLGPGVHHLIGANGSGKTTLLRCLCGGWRTSEGTVDVCGMDPRTNPDGRRKIALLAAEPELPTFLTVDEAWQELAALRGRPDWDGAPLRDHLGLPPGLPLAHCSAGQRRLAELLAAAAGDPAVLLLDEPFANLDPVSTERLVACLSGWRADRVLVITSHGPVPLPVDSEIAVSRTPRGPDPLPAA